MKMKHRWLELLTVVLALGVLFTTLLAKTSQTLSSPPATEKISSGDYQISGPYSYKNLSVFLVHGKDKLKGKNFLTLEEAIKQNKIIVYETGSVNELIVENISGDEIFIQAGDIVKGGKQDRVLSIDIILPRKSGKFPIKSFCVEHGRWHARGNEVEEKFNNSTDQVATKSLRIAVKQKGDQSEVWKEVATAQEKLSGNLGGSVKSEASESSLQLTLENKKVQQMKDEYVQALSKIVEDKNDVIGFVFAINGKINTGDIYASNLLFKKLWPKLLKASAVEAISELKENEKVSPPSLEEVKAFLAGAESGKSVSKEVSNRVKATNVENEKTLLYNTEDKDSKATVHKNYMMK